MAEKKQLEGKKLEEMSIDELVLAAQITAVGIELAEEAEEASFLNGQLVRIRREAQRRDKENANTS